MPGAPVRVHRASRPGRVGLDDSPRTPKSPSTPSSARELASSSTLLSGCRSDALGAVSTETEGSSNFSDLRAAARRGFLARRAGAGTSSSSSSSSSSASSSSISSCCGASAAQRDRGGSVPGRSNEAHGARRTRYQRSVGRAHQPAEPRLSGSSARDTPSRAKPNCGPLLPRRACHRPRSASASLGREPQPLANRKAAHIAANRMMPSTRR